MNYEEKCSDLVQAQRSSLVSLAEGSDEEDVEIISYFNILFFGISSLNVYSIFRTMFVMFLFMMVKEIFLSVHKHNEQTKNEPLNL